MLGEKSQLGLMAILSLNPDASSPLYRQLIEALRMAILQGRLRPGYPLPPTRKLANDLGVSRTTVLAAFEQLLSEGYLKSRMGSGTFVDDDLSEELLRAQNIETQRINSAKTRTELTEQRAEWQRYKETQLRLLVGSVAPFQPGLPALDAFPLPLWSRLASRLWRQLSPASLGYSDPAGYAPLREAIANYLRFARGVRCEAEQIVVVNGATQALDLIARVLVRPGVEAWVEDPIYTMTRLSLEHAHAKMIPVPVDSDGLRVDIGIAHAPKARLAYTTPSNQNPLGVTLSLARRLQLIEWAQKAKAWIVEDDYDSEFRYGARPVPSLQGLDTYDRVIYVGTFSKILFPALRIGFLVLPYAMLREFVAARYTADLQGPLLEQLVLTQFIEEGHLARHVRQVRSLYEKRQQTLVTALSQELESRIEASPTRTGTHLIAWLPNRSDDNAVAGRLLQHRIQCRPLSFHRLKQKLRPGLMLGFAAFNEKQIQSAVTHMAQVLRSAR